MIILQIGANKGNTDNDPIWKLCQEQLPNSLHWELYFVEPNPFSLDILKINYELAGFKNTNYFNCAITDQFKSVILYIDNDRALGSQHCSLHKDHMYKMGHHESVISEIEVQGVQLSEILDKINKPIDFLQIDTEGHDAVILLNCQLKKYNIKTIEYEWIHLKNQELEMLHSHLIQQGYTFIHREGEDERWTRKSEG